MALRPSFFERLMEYTNEIPQYADEMSSIGTGACKLSMISLKRYLDAKMPGGQEPQVEEQDLLETALIAYGAAMGAMGSSSVEACPSIGSGLKERLEELRAASSGARVGCAA